MNGITIKTRLRSRIRALASFIINIFACANGTRPDNSFEYGTFSGEMRLKTGVAREAHVNKEKPFKSCDFSRSFITFTVKHNGTHTSGRIQVEARCEINDNLTGQAENYYLVASCKGENVYSKGELFIKPSYDF